MKKRLLALSFLVMMIGFTPVIADRSPNSSPSTRILIIPLEAGFAAPTQSPTALLELRQTPPVSLDADMLSGESPDPFFPDLSEELSLDDLSDDDLSLDLDLEPSPSASAAQFALPQGNPRLPLTIDFPDLFARPSETRSDTPTADLAISLKPVALPGNGFEAIVTNLSGDLLSAVSVEINGATNVADLPLGCQVADRLIRCGIEQLASGQSVVLAFRTPLRETPQNKRMINAVTFFEGIDPDVTNNTAAYPPADALSGISTSVKYAQKKYSLSDLFVLPKAQAEESSHMKNSALVAQGLVMPVLAGEEQIQKDIVPTIAVDPKVVTPGEAIVLIMTISNRSQIQYKNVVATVFFPFDYLDLINASDKYAYDQAEESIGFVKETLNPGEQWLIRINGKVKEAAQVITADQPRAIVTSFMIEAEEPHLNDNFASTQTLVVKNKEIHNTQGSPAPAESPAASVTAAPVNGESGGTPSKPIYSPDIGLATTGPRQALVATLLAGMISGGLLLTRQYRRRTLAQKSVSS